MQKKADRIHLLSSSIGTYNICRCYFSYDPNYWYYYILDVSDELFLGVEEDDFILDGFHIRRLPDLKKVEIKDDLCTEINKQNHLLAGLDAPKIDISCWRTVFETLKPLNTFIIIENEKNRQRKFFFIGLIAEVKNTCVVFSPFDADGIWGDNVEIAFSDITSVTLKDRYSANWQEYLSKHNSN